MAEIKNMVWEETPIDVSAEANFIWSIANKLKDFEFAYFDSVDDALIEGLSQNQDFFTLLLQNEEMKKEVLGIFAEEVYNKLREN